MIWITGIVFLLTNLLLMSRVGSMSLSEWPLLAGAVMLWLLTEGMLRQDTLSAESTPEQVHRVAHLLGLQAWALSFAADFLRHLLPFLQVIRQVWFLLVPMLVMLLLVRKLNALLAPVEAELEITFRDRLLLGLRMAVAAAVFGFVSKALGIMIHDHPFNLLSHLVGNLVLAVTMAAAATAATYLYRQRAV